MRIPPQVIDEIARKTDIVTLIGQYVTLKPRGREFIGLSPFTQEKTPSFYVNPEKGVYHCFSSGKGGSVFTFLMELEKLSFVEAAEQLADRAGVEIPKGPEDPASRERDSLRELYNRVTGSFRHLYRESGPAASARAYLNGRKITAEIQERFAIGYAPADPWWLFSFLQKKQYRAEFLAKTGLFSANTDTRRGEQMRALFVNRLMFPIHDARGDVIAFGGRRLGDLGPKYLNSPETALFHKGATLYGLFHALPQMRKTRRVYLAEGYMDVIALHQAEVENAVAPLGTAFTVGQAGLLRRYVDTVILLFDSDAAGVRATRVAAEIIETAGLRCEVCTLGASRKETDSHTKLDAPKDPAEILEQLGPQELQNAAACTITVFDYLLTQSLLGVDALSASGREFVLQELFPYISRVQSAVARDSYLEAVADRLGMDRMAVREDFFRQGKPEPAPAVERKQETTSIDLFLMLATVVNREFFPFVRRTITLEELRDSRARDIFVALEECYRKEEESIELLLSRIEDTDTVRLVTEKLSSGEFSENAERAVRDGAYRVKERSLLDQRKRLDSLLRRAGETTNGVEQLLHEKMVLDREVLKLRVLLDDRTAE